MLTTTSIDEINLRRLLISCEKKLKEQSIELWTASEKRKYAAVRSIIQLVHTISFQLSCITSTLQLSNSVYSCLIVCEPSDRIGTKFKTQAVSERRR
ncbi:hypothetical protein BDF20DRAFT_814466 [Mycotypha africana]|uniref:uncharacterized protein n=1 Tax=Mycotypha africana TaxID=64632 RepID=UPI002301113F|nr:uncharacterized protein BDF20DRAFT_814466 [Mycotypha africana]KAI8987557.1 hypothetical protein BDF20DRAFT_814466 [Mycotypha africana]